MAGMKIDSGANPVPAMTIIDRHQQLAATPPLPLSHTLSLSLPLKIRVAPPRHFVPRCRSSEDTCVLSICQELNNIYFKTTCCSLRSQVK